MMFSIFNKNKKLLKKIVKLEREVDTLRSFLDVDPSLIGDFYNERKSASYCDVFKKSNPLVSICIPTYNRAKILTERTLPSLLDQSYKNIEIIVIGDSCTDETEALMNSVNDSRVYFENLSKRGDYPQESKLRWLVAGVKPANYALNIAKGDFITNLDDDDTYTLDKIEKLVDFAQKNNSDAIWHPFWYERKPGKWELRDCPEFRRGMVSSGSVFYHSWFKRLQWSADSYRHKEPGDWNRFRKLLYLGAAIHRYPEPLLRHYMEGSQK